MRVLTNIIFLTVEEADKFPEPVSAPIVAARRCRPTNGGRGDRARRANAAREPIPGRSRGRPRRNVEEVADVVARVDYNPVEEQGEGLFTLNVR